MYFTTDFEAAKVSRQMLADLEPEVSGPATDVQSRVGNARQAATIR
jgi:hypothetical protein